MSKLTIIQLLNKIAKGEEVPKKIKYKDWLYDWNELAKDYECGNDWLEERICDDFKIFLNDEVEIIEEDKEIEKIDIMSDEATPNSYYILNEHGTKCYLTKHSKVIADRVNLLIDKVNSLENKE